MESMIYSRDGSLPAAELLSTWIKTVVNKFAI